MYLGYQNDKIKFYTEQPLDQALYNLSKIEETDQEYVLDGDEYVLNDAEYQQKKAAERKALFENEFMETSYTYDLTGIMVDTALENVQVDKDTFGAKVDNAGTYEFLYTEGHWTLNNEQVDIAEYGITIEGEVEDNATITIVFSKETCNAWYRQIPHGYSNAPQSIDIINNMVNYQGSLKQDIAAMIKFYKKPDYAIAEQCTEEWLVANSFSPATMTKTEWKNFYMDFQSRWAILNYQRQLQTQEA